MSKPNPKIIVALDFDTLAEVEIFLQQVDPAFCRLKVGKSLFTKYGPLIISKLHEKGFEVFLDLKFHDIPQQVAGACKSAAELGVWMMNVHALGGLDMLKAARAAVDKNAKDKKPLLIGVTILTSLGENDLAQIGFSEKIPTVVLRLARLCFEAGLDGVVCSSQEASILKEEFGPKFLCVTPGIRLPGESTQDQKRVLTPTEALKAGADYLVMGRSITLASLPGKKLQAINEEIDI